MISRPTDAPLAAENPSRSVSNRHRMLAAAAIVVIWVMLLGFVRSDDLVQIFARLVGLVEHNFWPSVALYMLAYVTVVVLTLPISVGLTILGGAIFGPAVSFPLTVVTATLGASIAFLGARGMFHDLLMRRAGRWLRRLHGEFQSDAALYLLLLRVAPLLPFVIVNLIAALLGARLRTFVITTFFGIMPGTMAFTLIGAGMSDVLRREMARLAACQATGMPCPAGFSLHTLVTRDVLIGLAALACLVLISIIARRSLGRRYAARPDAQESQ